MASAGFREGHTDFWSRDSAPSKKRMSDENAKFIAGYFLIPIAFLVLIAIIQIVSVLLTGHEIEGL